MKTHNVLPAVAIFLLFPMSVMGAMRDKAGIRSMLEAVMDTEYCGDASMNGLGVDTMLRGEAPTEGMGFVDMRGTDWQSVLLEMMGEEIELCNAASVEQVKRLREVNEEVRKANLAVHPELREHYAALSWQARKDVEEVSDRLRRMLPLLENADGSRDDVLDMWGRLWKECPPEYHLWALGGTAAWVEGTLARKDVSRCLELGEWYRGRNGVDTPEHLAFCKCLCGNLAKLEGNDFNAGVRYLLSTADDMGHYALGCSLDKAMESGVPGWRGSLQRRDFASRLVYPGGTNSEKTVSVTDENGDIFLLHPHERLPWQARRELSAKESELNDLRQVYGDWTKEKAGE